MDIKIRKAKPGEYDKILALYPEASKKNQSLYFNYSSGSGTIVDTYALETYSAEVVLTIILK